LVYNNVSTLIFLDVSVFMPNRLRHARRSRTTPRIWRLKICRGKTKNSAKHSFRAKPRGSTLKLCYWNLFWNNHHSADFGSKASGYKLYDPRNSRMATSILSRYIYHELVSCCAVLKEKDFRNYDLRKTSLEPVQKKYVLGQKLDATAELVGYLSREMLERINVGRQLV